MKHLADIVRAAITTMLVLFLAYAGIVEIAGYAYQVALPNEFHVAEVTLIGILILWYIIDTFFIDREKK